MPVSPLIYATTDRELGAAELARLNENLIGEMGADRFSGPDEQALAVESCDEYHLLPDNLPKARTVVRAYPTSPFYGRGYQRGSWPELVAILEYLRHQIPYAEVWYGGDCSGEVELITPEWLASMWRFWAEYGSRAYYRK